MCRDAELLQATRQQVSSFVRLGLLGAEVFLLMPILALLV
jgi:hypothetical protein